jgi:hypothetical protein
VTAPKTKPDTGTAIEDVHTFSLQVAVRFDHLRNGNVAAMLRVGGDDALWRTAGICSTLQAAESLIAHEVDAISNRLRG